MAMRVYQVADEGDAFELALFEDGQQVGGAIIPASFGDDAAFELAQFLGECFAQQANSGDR